MAVTSPGYPTRAKLSSCYSAPPRVCQRIGVCNPDPEQSSDAKRWQMHAEHDNANVPVGATTANRQGLFPRYCEHRSDDEGGLARHQADQPTQGHRPDLLDLLADSFDLLADGFDLLGEAALGLDDLLADDFNFFLQAQLGFIQSGLGSQIFDLRIALFHALEGF